MFKKSKKLVLLVMVWITVTSMLVACGGGATATEAPAATEVPATEMPATEAPATEAPATEAPAAGERSVHHRYFQSLYQQ